MELKSSRFKVLIVLPSLHQGGVERQVSYLYCNLDRDLFDVHLAYFKNGDIFYRHLAEDPNAYLVGSGRKTSSDTFFSLAKLVKKLKPDVLHLYTESAILLGWMASLLVKVPVVLFAVRVTKVKPWRLFMIRHFMARSKTILVNSHGIYEDLIKAGFREDQVRIIHNFLDTSHYFPYSLEEKKRARAALKLPEGGMVIASLGRISYQKNQHGAVRALKNLRDRGALPERFKLLLYGKKYETDYELELKRMIRNDGLGSLCEIREPTEEIVSLYNAVDGLFQPVHFEGLSNVVIEALACGAPVALSQEGDNDCLIEDGKNGVSFSLSSEEETARGLKALIDLCGDGERRREMAENARRSVLARFSVEEKIREVQEIYLKLLQKEPCAESSGSLTPKKY